jgi:hypothetical protein
MHTLFWWGNLKERYHLEDTSVDGRTIFKRLFGEWDWDTDRVNLAPDMDRWRALVNAVLNFRVP